LLLCGKLSVKTKNETRKLIAGQVSAAADTLPFRQTDLVRGEGPIKKEKAESNKKHTK
jgi:hypothetical protein